MDGRDEMRGLMVVVCGGYRYGRDELLTEAYAPDIWVEYY